jgi:hypothetical protein
MDFKSTNFLREREKKGKKKKQMVEELRKDFW